MMWRFSAAMRAIVARARQIAKEHGSGNVGEAQLFLALLDLSRAPESTISTLLAVSSVSREEAQLYAQNALETAPLQPNRHIRLTLGARQALRMAVTESGLEGNLTVEPRHLFLACLAARRGAHLGEVMRPLGLDVVHLRAHLRGLRRSEGQYRAGNPLNRLTCDGARTIEAAQLAARAAFRGRIGAAHLLIGLLGDEKILQILHSAGCDANSLKQRARESIQSDGEVATAQKKFAPDARRVVEDAARQAKLSRRMHLDSRDLLLGFLPPAQAQREERRDGGRNPDFLTELWTPAQVESLRYALQGIRENEAPSLPEEFTNWRLMRFLQVANVAFSAALGVLFIAFCNSIITGPFTKAIGEIFLRCLVATGLVSAISEGFFSGQAHTLRSAAGFALGVAISFCWWFML